jgi:hypothetical protein
VTGLVELIGGGETSGPGANDGNLLAGANLRRTRLHPAHLESLVDDRASKHGERISECVQRDEQEEERVRTRCS